jgi:hypothetical protein
MKKTTLEEIINKELAYLFSDYQFQKTGYGYHPELMGNEGFDVSNGKTMISFTKDRDQLLVYFGHPGLPRPKWYTLTLLLKAKKITNVAAHKFISENGERLTTGEQAKYISPIIKTYCGDILSGNWGIKGDIFIAGKERAEEVIRELTGKK